MFGRVKPSFKPPLYVVSKDSLRYVNPCAECGSGSGVESIRALKALPYILYPYCYGTMNQFTLWVIQVCVLLNLLKI